MPSKIVLSNVKALWKVKKYVFSTLKITFSGICAHLKDMKKESLFKFYRKPIIKPIFSDGAILYITTEEESWNIQMPWFLIIPADFRIHNTVIWYPSDMISDIYFMKYVAIYFLSRFLTLQAWETLQPEGDDSCFFTM